MSTFQFRIRIIFPNASALHCTALHYLLKSVVDKVICLRQFFRVLILTEDIAADRGSCLYWRNATLPCL